jgi:DNA-directed RNA polymerase subunit H (RpoH/RPB5)
MVALPLIILYHLLMPKTDYLSFEKAKEVVRGLKIFTLREWRNWSKTPERKMLGLPSDPWRKYKDQWVSWSDFISKKDREPSPFITYEEALAIVRDLNFSSAAEYARWSKTPDRLAAKIPAMPSRYYKTQWISWAEFLGSVFVSYSEAETIVRRLNITTLKQWYAWSGTAERVKLNLPSNPRQIYKEEWISWNYFVGKDLRPPRNFVTYSEAKTILKELGISHIRQYMDFRKTDRRTLLRLPTNPIRYYKSDWKDWNDFLCSDNATTHCRSKSFVSYEEAQSIIKEKGILTVEKFRLLLKSTERPQGVPSNPDKYYDEWISWKDFFDTRGKLNKLARKSHTNRPEISEVT